MAGRLFKAKTTEEQTTSLAAFLPGGRPFLAAKLSSSTLRTLLVGLGTELSRMEGILNDITYEHQIDQTTSLISQWEAALGIPDGCFSVASSLSDRIRNVSVKLGHMSLQTAQDYIDLGALLGYTVRITAGADRGIFPLAFPAYVFDSPQTARFLMIVTVETVAIPNVFPLSFQITFSNGFNTIIECVLKHLVPANVQLSFEYTLPDLGAFIDEYGFYYLGTEDGDILLLE